jgi:hypothetical protein
MTGIEHPYLMPALAQDRGERLNPERRKRHDSDSAVAAIGAPEFRRQEIVEVFVPDVS